MDISKTSNSSLSMAALFAASKNQALKLYKGQEVTGKVVFLTPSDVILDLGSKSEGVISKKDLTPDKLSTLKIGDKLDAFVFIPENKSGQAVLTLDKDLLTAPRVGRNSKNQGISKKWQKFFHLKQQGSKVKGLVVEINKGGLVIEIDGVRGFLPGSQLRLENLKQANFKSGSMDNLIGQEITVTVIEVSLSNNRLIFTGKSEINTLADKLLEQLAPGQEVSGKIEAITPFGLFLSLDNLEGFVPVTHATWDKEIGLNQEFKIGEEVRGKVLDIEEDRVSLSLKDLAEDPFDKIAENFLVDDVVRGVITSITAAGINVSLKDPSTSPSILKGSGQVILEGFIPAQKLEPGNQFSIGEEASFLVDSIDKTKRRINLAPFITSTVGLIYK